LKKIIVLALVLLAATLTVFADSLWADYRAVVRCSAGAPVWLCVQRWQAWGNGQ